MKSQPEETPYGHVLRSGNLNLVTLKNMDMATNRPILSYDDISEPSTWEPPHRPNDHSLERPAKRGRWNRGGRANFTRQRPHAHWDDPADSAPTVSYDTNSPYIAPLPPSPEKHEAVRPTNENEANRSVAPTPAKAKSKAKSKASQRSISLVDTDDWNDSALTSAWDAANEEYEVRPSCIMSR